MNKWINESALVHLSFVNAQLNINERIKFIRRDQCKIQNKSPWCRGWTYLGLFKRLPSWETPLKNPVSPPTHETLNIHTGTVWEHEAIQGRLWLIHPCVYSIACVQFCEFLNCPSHIHSRRRKFQQPSKSPRPLCSKLEQSVLITPH